MVRISSLVSVLLLGLVAIVSLPACADEPAKPTDAKNTTAAKAADTNKTDNKTDSKADDAKSDDAKANGAEAPKDLKRLSKTHDIWLDTKRKAVVIDGQVALREGQLEMFACPKNTKEHESVVSLNCSAEEVHAGLLAAGAKPGTTVKFDPKYVAATGDIIDVYVLWTDAEGKQHQVRAQDWIKNHKTGKAMDYDWVFAGSGFWKDEETGKLHYQANGGDLICVSNFPTATLDLPVESTQANSNLLFTANTDKIPPKGTKIRVVLIPRKKKA